MKIRTTKHIPWSDLTYLVSKMKEENNRLHLLITIQAMLGLRIGDVLKLRWKDFSNAELSLIEQKTGKTRKMIVNDSLMEAVESEFNRKFGIRKRDLIFINKHKTGSISISYVNRQLKASFKKHGLDNGQQISSHVIRKSWCYKILEDNSFSEKAIFTISSMLNHANIETTMKYLLLDQREADNIYKSLTI